MHLKVCKFGCDPSVIYVSLFEEPCAFSGLYRIVMEEFYIHIPQSLASILVLLVSLDQ